MFLSYDPRGTIHLLVSRRENVGESLSDPEPLRTKLGWLDAEAVWVMISPRTGRAMTAENVLLDAEKMIADNSSMTPYERETFSRHAAREFTRSNFSLGGR